MVCGRCGGASFDGLANGSGGPSIQSGPRAFSILSRSHMESGQRIAWRIRGMPRAAGGGGSGGLVVHGPCGGGCGGGVVTCGGGDGNVNFTL